MAQQITTQYIDDIDGSDAVGSTSFSVDGAYYEIDLSEQNRDQLKKALQPFIDAARRVDGRREAPVKPRRARPETALSRRVHLAQVRVWARQQGHTVNDRGRVPDFILQAYDAARVQAHYADQP